jgi:protein CpxP
MKRTLIMCFLLVGSIAIARAQSNQIDPVGKAKGLQKQLQLNDRQTEKITTIYRESAEKFEQIKDKAHGNTNKMLESVRPLRVATIRKIKALLTRHQAVRFEELLNESSNQGLNGGWSGGWGATS